MALRNRVTCCLISLSSFLSGLTMLSIKISLACSTLSSSEAFAWASAFLRSDLRVTRVTRKPPPKMRFNTSDINCNQSIYLSLLIVQYFF